jgi:predicted AAA+ superfamily ATPase
VRGVGKSTWARETVPDAHIIDLLDESRYQALVANPALLGLELRTLPAHRVVVLDEVRRVAALLNEVHRAIEGARRRFVLLGSSARRLKTADANLLAGRAALQTMYPLVPAELGTDFDVARVLRFGSIPVVWQADDPRAALEANVQLPGGRRQDATATLDAAALWPARHRRAAPADAAHRRVPRRSSSQNR